MAKANITVTADIRELFSGRKSGAQIVKSILRDFCFSSRDKDAYQKVRSAIAEECNENDGLSQWKPSYVLRLFGRCMDACNADKFFSVDFDGVAFEGVVPADAKQVSFSVPVVFDTVGFMHEVTDPYYREPDPLDE